MFQNPTLLQILLGLGSDVKSVEIKPLSTVKSKFSSPPKIPWIKVPFLKTLLLQLYTYFF